MGSVIAAGTSYATHGAPMIPVYVFYSMFGWQRTGDQMWALGDQLGRGFLLGATAGPHHADRRGPAAQRRPLACCWPRSARPAWPTTRPGPTSWATSSKDGLRRMYGPTEGHPDGEDIFYYLTVYNEPYVQQPADYPGGSAALEQGVLRGLYRYAPHPRGLDRYAGRRQAAEARTGPAGPAERPRAQILASGVAMRWALEAQRLLAEDWGVAADVWSATSWTQLRRNALGCEEWNMLHPDAEPQVPYVTQALEGQQGPVVAVSDWIRAVPDQIARWVPGAVHLAGHRRVRLLRHPRRPPAGSSTWTRSRSPWPCSASWPGAAR